MFDFSAKRCLCSLFYPLFIISFWWHFWATTAEVMLVLLWLMDYGCWPITFLVLKGMLAVFKARLHLVGSSYLLIEVYNFFVKDMLIEVTGIFSAVGFLSSLLKVSLTTDAFGLWSALTGNFFVKSIISRFWLYKGLWSYSSFDAISNSPDIYL